MIWQPHLSVREVLSLPSVIPVIMIRFGQALTALYTVVFRKSPLQPLPLIVPTPWPGIG